MTDTQAAPLLEVKDVVAGYVSEVDILHGVSITVHGGEMVAIIGPNGAGKSTLLRAIFGLLAVRQGQINLKGQDITNRRTDALPVFREDKQVGNHDVGQRIDLKFRESEHRRGHQSHDAPHVWIPKRYVEQREEGDATQRQQSDEHLHDAGRKNGIPNQIHQSRT